MTDRPGGGPRAALAVGLVLGVSLVFRLVAFPFSTERNMDPDAAHFLNVAREFSRGHGFVNPGAWPAWMKPETLPMPETFKEPGYPWTIARVTPLVGDPFLAGKLLSFVAGVLLPLALYRLARNLGADRATAAAAGLLCAGSPRLISQSVRVMVDSLFPLLMTLAFAAAAWRPERGARRTWAADALAGALAGAAFLMRGQTLVALPAFALLALSGRPARRGLGGLALAAIAGTLVASPFLLRNLRLFGTPFYSDVGSYGIWPYVDHLQFSHSLERPPAPIRFALAHLPQVAAHWVWSAGRFFGRTLVDELLGNPLWTLPAAAGLLIGLSHLRRWAFAYLYLALTMTFIFAVNWDARYFVSNVPIWCLFAGLGAVALGRAIADVPLGLGLRGIHLIVPAAAFTLAIQAEVARRDAAIASQPEIDAAMHEAPFLREHLKPDESVMVVRTSYWSWFADRHSVHLVIADERRFLEVVRRLKVRYAALETSQIPAFAARFPDGRLPRELVPLRTDAERDLTMFEVVDPEAAGASP